MKMKFKDLIRKTFSDLPMVVNTLTSGERTEATSTSLGVDTKFEELRETEVESFMIFKDRVVVFVK